MFNFPVHTVISRLPEDLAMFPTSPGFQRNWPCNPVSLGRVRCLWRVDYLTVWFNIHRWIWNEPHLHWITIWVWNRHWLKKRGFKDSIRAHLTCQLHRAHWHSFSIHMIESMHFLLIPLSSSALGMDSKTYKRPPKSISALAKLCAACETIDLFVHAHPCSSQPHATLQFQESSEFVQSPLQAFTITQKLPRRKTKSTLYR